MGWRNRGFGWNCLIGLNENASPYAPEGTEKVVKRKDLPQYFAYY